MKYLGISARSCRGNFAPRFRQNQDIFEKPSKKNFAASRENKNFPSRKDAKFLSISHGDTEARSFLSANNPLHLRLNHSQIFVAIRGFFFFTFLKTSRLGGFARKQKLSLAQRRKDAKFLSISHGDTEARSFLSANNPLHLRLNHSQIFVAIRGFFFFTFLKTSRLGGFARKQKPANPVLNRLAGDLKWCGWRSRTLQLPFK